MSNFVYYEHIEDYEEQVKKAKLCDEKDKEIERLTNELDREKSKVKEYGTRLLKAIEYIEDSDIWKIGREICYYKIDDMRFFENLNKILRGNDEKNR